jgi:hypothetical protein
MGGGVGGAGSDAAGGGATNGARDVEGALMVRDAKLDPNLEARREEADQRERIAGECHGQADHVKK